MCSTFKFCFFEAFWNLKYIYLFLAALGLCCFSQAFYSWGKQRLLFFAVHVFLIAVASLGGGVWVLGCLGSAVVAHQFSCSDARESSQTRNQARAPCTGRQILIHCTTREVLEFFKKYFRPLVCWICRCRTHTYGGLSMIRTLSCFLSLREAPHIRCLNHDFIMFCASTHELQSRE